MSKVGRSDGREQARLIKISTTSDKRETLERIARELVGNNLAACAQISGPIESIYRWNSKIESTDEWLLTAKTVETRFADVDAVIQTAHHYDVPQVVAEAIAFASDSYAKWVRNEVV